MSPYEKLANAIIEQAAKDYRRALRDEGCRESEKMIRDCERFFCSQWFEMLSDVDGERLMNLMRREVVA